jgi:hypothetical protein
MKIVLRDHHSESIDRLLPPEKWYRAGVFETFEQVRYENGSEANHRRGGLLAMRRYAEIAGVFLSSETSEIALEPGQALVRTGILQAVGEQMCHATVVRAPAMPYAKGVREQFPHSIVGMWVTKNDEHWTGYHYDNRHGNVERGLFTGAVADLCAPIKPYKGPIVAENLLNLGRLDVVLKEVEWQDPAVVDVETFFAKPTGA